MKAKKILAMILAVVLLMTATIAGTIAWLTDDTDTVENTFTVGDIEIDLDEKDVDDSTEDKDRDIANSYKLIPGTKYVKDPTVTVKNKSEACYLFIKVDDNWSVTDNKGTADDTTDDVSYKLSDYLTYSVDGTKWAPLNDANSDGIADDGVYYYKGDLLNAQLTKDETITILTGEGEGEYAKGYITVKDTVTKKMMSLLNDNNLPKLTFKAYAIQQANITAASGQTVYEAAWVAITAPTP